MHNGIVYQAGTLGVKTLFRCAGHGAVPNGETPDLQVAVGKTVEWYESLSAKDKFFPTRVLNGFVELALHGPELRETFKSELGVVRWSRHASA